MVERYICTTNATGRIAKPRPTRMCSVWLCRQPRAAPPDAEISFEPERSTDEDERGGWPMRASTMTRRSFSSECVTHAVEIAPQFHPPNAAAARMWRETACLRRETRVGTREWTHKVDVWRKADRRRRETACQISTR